MGRIIKGWGYALRTSIPFRYSIAEVGNLALSQMIVMLWKPGMTMDFAVSEAMKIVPDVWADRQQ